MKTGNEDGEQKFKGETGKNQSGIRVIKQE